MADDDWYIEAGKARLQEIAAERAQHLANLEAAKRDDPYGAGVDVGNAVQQIANLDAEHANLMNLYQRYWNSQHPPAAPPQTKEQLNAKPWEQLTYSDVWELSKSKYGPPDEAKFREGIAEAARRRGRGE
jgi:hypothetical protein